MRGLTIIVASAKQVRLRSALGLALSHAALGGAARIFLDTAAAGLVRTPILGRDDAVQIAGGMPALADLVAEALHAEVSVMLCQAGVAMAGATTADFDPRVEFSGMVGLLADLGDDRLLIA